MKRFMITKNSVVKFQNLFANHESQPVKLNSEKHTSVKTLLMITIRKFQSTTSYALITPLKIIVAVFVYLRSIFPLQVISVQYLQKCINFELKIGGKICNFISLYIPSSQTQDNLKNNLSQNNSFLIAFFEYLNAKSIN